MLIHFIKYSVIVLGIGLVSCNGAYQTGSSGTSRKIAGAKICDPKKDKTCNNSSNGTPTNNTPNDNTTPNGQTNPPNGSTDPGTLLSQDSGGLCLTRAPEIHFAFAMDVSGSMDEESARVQASFQTLAMNLKNIQIPGLGSPSKVGFTLLTFEDAFYLQTPILYDFNQVQALMAANFIAKERGTDGNENGLGAAAQSFLNLSSGGEAVNVLFVVTDAFSHDGIGPEGRRTYTTSQIEQVLANPAMKYSFIYSASDFSGGAGNRPSDARNAVDQWSNLRNKVAAGAGHAPLGKDFNIDNFTAAEVSAQIPLDIATHLRKCSGT